ncbi:MAG TPA: hypothetical protein VF756_30910 [Thermoanaerobaculia bacterium]
MTPLLSALVLAASTFALPPALSAPAACSSAPALVEQASFDFDSGETVNADCTASCGSYPPVSCSGSTCFAVDRSCPEQRGYATCDGVTYYCPVCTPITCTEGSFRTLTVGPTCGCEYGTSTPKERQQCINGQWEHYSYFCGAPFCQGY